jgi:hypothetical protein
LYKPRTKALCFLVGAGYTRVTVVYELIKDAGLKYIKNRIMGIFFILFILGCVNLDAAREQFYSGSYDRANETIPEINPDDKDSVLMFMERGTMLQSRGEYFLSSEDYIAAAVRLKELETYSVSKGASSLLINDYVQNYVGAPYERTLLHTFTALDHMAMSHWEKAGVESRKAEATLNPIERGDYPDIAFARYIAGFGFEMIDDYSNAAIQYGIADKLSEYLQVDTLGKIVSKSSDHTHGNTNFPDSNNYSCELVCVVLMGRTPKGSEDYSGAIDPFSYATISIGDKVMGRSYSLSNTGTLIAETKKATVALKSAKVVGRVAVKEGVASVLENNNQEALAALVRFTLIGLLERPDLRRWETLPLELQVARVPCPEDLKGFTVTFKNSPNDTGSAVYIESPITKRRNKFFSMVRDLPYP